MKSHSFWFMALVVSGVAAGTVVQAAEITLNASDASGTSSFNAAGHWSNAQAPSAGNTYATGSFDLRTPTSTGNLTFGGDSLRVDSGGRFVVKAASSIFTFNNGGLILNGGGVVSASLGASSTVAGTVDVMANSFFQIGVNNEILNVDSIISGSANLTIISVFNGIGTVVFKRSNTHTGATIVDAYGNLRLANQNALQYSTLKMNGNASSSLKFDSAVAANAFNIGGLAATNPGTGYNIDLRNNAGTPAAVALTVGGNNSNTTYAAVLSGSGSLIKTGSGTLTLSGTNTYSGVTTVSNGYISVGNNLALSTNLVTLAGGGLSAASGTWAITNTINLASNSTIDTAGNNLELAGAITNSGGLTKTGGGILTLSGINTYTGATIVTNGVLSLTRTNSLSTNTTVWIWSGATNDLNFTGTNTIQTLYINGVPKGIGVYSTNNLPDYLTGAGYLQTLSTPVFQGSVYRFY